MADEKKLLPVVGLDQSGLVKDVPAHILASNAFTDGRNITFNNGSVNKRKGTTKAFNDVQETTNRIKSFNKGSGANTAVITFTEEVSIVEGNSFVIADATISGYNGTFTALSISLDRKQITITQDLSGLSSNYIEVTASNFNSSTSSLHPALASKTTGIPLYFESSVANPTPGSSGDTASNIQNAQFSKIFYFTATGGYHRYTGQIDFLNYWPAPNDNQYIEIQRNTALTPNTTSFFSIKEDGLRRQIFLAGAEITAIDKNTNTITFARDPELSVGEPFFVIDCSVADYNTEYTVSSISGNNITTTQSMAGFASPPANDTYPNDFGRQINTSIFPEDYFAFQRQDWQSSTFLGGYAFIINNGYHTPQYILGSDGDIFNPIALRPLPGWDWQSFGAGEDYHIGAKVVRGYKNVLLAGNLKQYAIASNGAVDTIAEKSFPGTVRVSTAAAAGEIPRTWQPGAGNEFADEFEISTTSPIQDIVSLQGVAIIYTTNSIHSLQFDSRGNASVQTVAEGYGALDTGCVIEFDGKHLVIGSDDIYLFGGHPGSIQSICENKIRDYFYDNLNSSPNAISNIFMIRDVYTDEIKIFYPTKNASANLLCNEYIAWNYRNNTWTINDANDVVSGTIGPLRGGGVASGSIQFAGVGNASASAKEEEQEIVVTLDSNFSAGPAEVQSADYTASQSTNAATLDTESFNLEVPGGIVPYNEEQLNVTFNSSFNSGNTLETISQSGTNSTETNIDGSTVDVTVSDTSISKTLTTSSPQGNTLPQSNGVFTLGTINFSTQRFGWGGNYTASGREAWTIPSQSYYSNNRIKLTNGGTYYTDRPGGWLWPNNQNVNNNYHEVLLTVRAERESGGGAYVSFPLTWGNDENADAVYRVEFRNDNGDGPGSNRFYISGAEYGDTDESGVLTSSGSAIRYFIPGRGNTITFYHQVPRDGGSSVSMAWITILAGNTNEGNNELLIPRTKYSMSDTNFDGNLTLSATDNNSISYSVLNNNSSVIPEFETTDYFSSPSNLTVAARSNYSLAGTVPAETATFDLDGDSIFANESVYLNNISFPSNYSASQGAQFLVDTINTVSSSNLRAIVDSTNNRKAKIYYRTQTDANLNFFTTPNSSNDVANASTSDFTIDPVEIKTLFSSYNIKVKDSSNNLVSNTDIALDINKITPSTIGTFIANEVLADVNASSFLVNDIEWTLNNPGTQPGGSYIIRFETNSQENYSMELLNTTSIVDDNIVGVSDSIVFTENLGTGTSSSDLPDVIKIKGPTGNTFNSLSAFSNESYENLLTRLIANFNSISNSGWSAVLNTTANTVTFTADNSGRYPIQTNSTESQTYPGYGVFDIIVSASTQNTSAGNLPSSVPAEITTVGAQDSVQITLFDPTNASSTNLRLGGQNANDIASSLASKINSSFNNWTASSTSNVISVKSIAKDWVLANRNPTVFDTTLDNRAVYVSNIAYPADTLGSNSNIPSGNVAVSSALNSNANFFTRDKTPKVVGHPIINPTTITLTITTVNENTQTSSNQELSFLLPDGASASEMASATELVIQSSVDGLNANASGTTLSISALGEVAVSNITTNFDDASKAGNQFTISRSNGNNIANANNDPFPSSDETSLDPYTDLERPYAKDKFNLGKDYPVIATQSTIVGQNFGYTNNSNVYTDVKEEGTTYLSYVERIQLPISGTVEYTLDSAYTQILADEGNVNVIIGTSDAPGAAVNFANLPSKDFNFNTDYKVDHRLNGRVFHIKIQDEGGTGKATPWRVSGYGFKTEPSSSRGKR